MMSGTGAGMNFLLFSSRYHLTGKPDELREELLAVLQAMRKAHHHRSIHRCHSDPRRCHYCGDRSVCDETLVH
jgi:hypothetical protein